MHGGLARPDGLLQPAFKQALADLDGPLVIAGGRKRPHQPNGHRDQVARVDTLPVIEDGPVQRLAGRHERMSSMPSRADSHWIVSMTPSLVGWTMQKFLYMLLGP